MIGRRAPHDVWVHIAGIDIVRVDDEEFYVLEDNARTPSGVSYMLENREVTMRLLPDLFARHRVAPVDDYPGRAARLPALGRAAPGPQRGDDRRPDAGALQFGLLRALLPRRQARGRAGRGPRPVRRGRPGVHAHDARAAPGRRHLPPRRRRFPRPAGVQSGFGARRSGADRRLFGGQRDALRMQSAPASPTTRRSTATSPT